MTFKAIALWMGVISASSVPAAQRLRMIWLHAPQSVLHVQVADTQPQRELGLMGVKRLAPHTGMLFVFDADAQVSFWMKNTLVPLDMVFLSPAGVVRKVYARVRTLPRGIADENIPLETGTAKYVIELPAGEASRDGIYAGSRIIGLP